VAADGGSQPRLGTGLGRNASRICGSAGWRQTAGHRPASVQVYGKGWRARDEGALLDLQPGTDSAIQVATGRPWALSEPLSTTPPLLRDGRGRKQRWGQNLQNPSSFGRCIIRQLAPKLNRTPPKGCVPIWERFYFWARRIANPSWGAPLRSRIRNPAGFAMSAPILNRTPPKSVFDSVSTLCYA